jgi:hypothetical protein
MKLHHIIGLVVAMALATGCASPQNPLALPADRPALLFFYTDN